MNSENSKACDGRNGCGEEHKEVVAAAETLVAMKHKKMSKKEAKELRKLMAKQRAHGEDDKVADDFPVVPCLRGMVKECSSAAVEKLLTRSDVVVSQNRLNLTKKVVEESFLPMLKDDEDVKSGIPVSVYDEDGKVYSLTFIFWSDKLYVLNGGWKEFFLTHGLQETRDRVKVWMFRHSRTNKLCFLIIHRRLSDPNHEKI